MAITEPFKSPPIVHVTAPPFNADKTGATDSTVRIQNAINSMTNGGTLVFAPGVYWYSNTLIVDNPNVKLWGYGATLEVRGTGDTPTPNGIQLRVNNTHMYGFIKVSPPSWKRKPGYPLYGISLRAINHEVIDNRIRYGSGILMSGVRDMLIARNVLYRTFADAIHVTGNTTNVRILGNTVRENGDDMIAVVDYGDGAATISNILAENNDCSGQFWGRGMTVIGGKNVTFRNNIVNKCCTSAGMLISIQDGENWSFANISNILIENNHISQIQTTTPAYKAPGSISELRGFGGISIRSFGHGTIQNVLVRNNTIDDTRLWGMEAKDSLLSGISFVNNTMTSIGRAPALDVLSPAVAHCSGNTLEGSPTSSPQCTGSSPTVTGSSYPADSSVNPPGVHSLPQEPGAPVGNPDLEVFGSEAGWQALSPAITQIHNIGLYREDISDDNWGWEATGGLNVNQASLAQFASADGDPAVPSLASVPAEGNLLVAAAQQRSGTSETNFTISGTGWTKRIARDVSLGDSNDRQSFAVWTKIAGASEPQSVTLDDGTANAKLGTLAEYAFGSGEGEWTFIAGATNDNGATDDATSIATGTTASIIDTGGKKFLIAFLFIRRSAHTAAYTAAWTSGTLTAGFSIGAASGGRHISSGHGNSDTDGTKASNGIISGPNTANQGMAAGIMVFRTQAGAVDVDSAEIGWEGLSADITQIHSLSVNGAGSGWEAMSAHFSIGGVLSVDASELGFEAGSLALVQQHNISDVTRVQLGWEGRSVNLTQIHNLPVTHAEFGHEALSLLASDTAFSVAPTKTPRKRTMRVEADSRRRVVRPGRR